MRWNGMRISSKRVMYDLKDPGSAQTLMIDDDDSYAEANLRLMKKSRLDVHFGWENISVDIPAFGYIQLGT